MQESVLVEQGITLFVDEALGFLNGMGAGIVAADVGIGADESLLPDTVGKGFADDAGGQEYPALCSGGGADGVAFVLGCRAGGVGSGCLAAEQGAQDVFQAHDNRWLLHRTCMLAIQFRLA